MQKENFLIKVKKWIKSNFELETAYYQELKLLKNSKKTLKKELKEQNSNKLKRYVDLEKIFTTHSIQHLENKKFYFLKNEILFKIWIKNLLNIYMYGSKEQQMVLNQLGLFNHDHTTIFDRVIYNQRFVPINFHTNNKINSLLMDKHNPMDNCANKNVNDNVEVLWNELIKEIQLCKEQNIIEQDVNQYQFVTHIDLLLQDKININNPFINNDIIQLIEDDWINNGFNSEIIKIMYQPYAKILNIENGENNLLFPNLNHLFESFKHFFKKQTGYSDQDWGKTEYEWLNHFNHWDLWSEDNKQYILPYLLLGIFIQYQEGQVYYTNDEENQKNIPKHRINFQIHFKTKNELNEKYHYLLNFNDDVKNVIKNNYEILETECFTIWNKDRLKNALNIFNIEELPVINQDDIEKQYLLLKDIDIMELKNLFNFVNEQTVNQVFNFIKNNQNVDDENLNIIML